MLTMNKKTIDGLADGPADASPEANNLMDKIEKNTKRGEYAAYGAGAGGLVGVVASAFYDGGMTPFLAAVGGMYVGYGIGKFIYNYKQKRSEEKENDKSKNN